MKSSIYISVVLLAGGLVGGCSADDKEVGEVNNPVPVPWYTGPRNQPLGASCQPLDQWEPSFSGFQDTEVHLEDRSPGCASGYCLVNHFQGRQNCPYGQAAPEDPNQFDSPPCMLPDGTGRVTVAVEPQDVNRPPEDAVYCSCRCDGLASTGPFCQCPSGFECKRVIEFSLDEESAHIAGSYCIKAGTAYDPNMIPEPCDWETQSCGPG